MIVLITPEERKAPTMNINIAKEIASITHTDANTFRAVKDTNKKTLGWVFNTANGAAYVTTGMTLSPVHSTRTAANAALKRTAQGTALIAAHKAIRAAKKANPNATPAQARAIETAGDKAIRDAVTASGANPNSARTKLDIVNAFFAAQRIA